MMLLGLKKLLAILVLVQSAVAEKADTKFSVNPVPLTTTSSSALKRITLRRPANLISYQYIYTVRASSSRVCQLRIDFTVFRLAPPTVNPFPECGTDVFSVNNVIRLCGENSQQHIYVPFNRTAGLTSIDLRINLSDRMIFPNLINPDWNILVTQLDCPQGSPLRDDSEPFEETISPRTVFNDGYWIAPVGCLQYFPNPSGIFESFNYNFGNGPYLGGMQYAICFRRTANDQRIVLTPFHFQMAIQDSTIQQGFDLDCLPQIQTIGRSEDYFMIPGGLVQGTPNFRATRFCSNSITGSSVTTSLPGPIVLYFNSDTEFQQPQQEIGFRIGYQIS